MAGGNWDSQNKLQPGVYINFKSNPSLLVSVGERGIVGIGKKLSWGEPATIQLIESTTDVFKKLGYDITADEMLFMREIFRGTALSKGASKVYVYRLPVISDAAATKTIGALTVTAKYKGTRGNDITMIITADPDTETSTTGTYACFTVQTVVDGTIQDSQYVGSFTSTSVNTPAKIGDLVNNDWVEFTGTATAALTATAGAALTGGADGSLATTAYSDFLTALEPYTFNTVVYDGTDATIKAAFAAFVKRVSYEQGYYCQAVVSDYPAADNETCISVKNGITLMDDTELEPEEACWWVAGVTAGANYNQSLTYAVHPFAKAVSPKYKSSELDDAIKEGSFVFLEEWGTVKVLTDINTFTSYTPTKGKAFSKNRVVRVLFAIANDIYNVYSKYYIGKVDNNADGRKLLKAEIVGYVNELQANNGVQNFVADDVVVDAGTDSDAVVITCAIQPVDSVEKIYMTVTVS